MSEDRIFKGQAGRIVDVIKAVGLVTSWSSGKWLCAILAYGLYIGLSETKE